MAKLYFYYASMNAGKSFTLLQADFNYRERAFMERMGEAEQAPLPLETAPAPAG